MCGLLPLVIAQCSPEERERASVGGTSLEVALTVSFLSQSCSFVVRSGDARDATYATPRFIISTVAIGEECVWRCGGVVVAVLVETWIPCWLGNGAVLALEPWALLACALIATTFIMTTIIL